MMREKPDSKDCALQFHLFAIPEKAKNRGQKIDQCFQKPGIWKGTLGTDEIYITS